MNSMSQIFRKNFTYQGSVQGLRRTWYIFLMKLKNLGESWGEIQEGYEFVYMRFHKKFIYCTCQTWELVLLKILCEIVYMSHIFETISNTRVMCRWYVGLSTNVFDKI